MKRNNLLLFSTFCAILLTALPLFAEIRVSAIFGNKMVLQRETNVFFWGTANASANVEVITSWNGATYSTQALANGRWRLQIPTPVAGGPYTVTLIDRSDNKSMLLEDILIGEVWVCSGQSNMEMPMKGYSSAGQFVNGSAAAVAASLDPNLRFFVAPYIVGSEGPQDTFRGQAQSKRWVSADVATTPNFSATAYFFARELRRKLNVPVGVVAAHWGGTRIEVWMSESSITAINPSLGYVNPETSTATPLKSSCLYNYLINPMVGYGIRGFLWYQGEANTAQASDYQKLLPALIKDWREKWGLGDLPFYYAQIAPFGGNTGANNGANLREAQLNVSNPTLTPNLPNIGMACNLDIGEQASVHPANKEPVSVRLANLAFSNVYGFPNINPYSPIFKTMTATGNTATLTFETFSDTTFLTSYTNPISNFELAGANGIFYPATAVISSNKTITLTSTSVSRPVSVRHGFKNFIVGDLFGTNGVPVSSFRLETPKLTIVSWEASTQLQGGRTVTDFAPNYIDANLTTPSVLTRGSGVVVPTTAASNGYWGANDCSITTAEDGIAANKFLLFSLKSKAGKSVNYISIDKFNIRISASGPIKYQIDYQIDGGTFSPCATVTGPPRTTGNYTIGPVDLSNISFLQNVTPDKTVTFRITPFDATSVSGSFLIGSGTTDTDADFSLTGAFTEGVVPVTLSDFTSNKIKDKVLLKWETKSEVNFHHFDLERSTDGKAFYSIAKINASKLSIGSQYDYIDNTPNTTNYYRLKMVDIDGRFEYSKVLSESFDAAKTPFSVYPSISKGSTIEAIFEKISEAAQIKVFNINGQLMNIYNLKAGASSETIDISSFTEGVYFLVLQDNGTIQSKKFVKQ